jgi:hypothetical protein
VCRSSDGGLTRTAASRQPADPYIPALTANGTALLAGTNGGGVFRSADGGLTWTVAMRRGSLSQPMLRSMVECFR